MRARLKYCAYIFYWTASIVTSAVFWSNPSFRIGQFFRGTSNLCDRKNNQERSVSGFRNNLCMCVFCYARWDCGIKVCYSPKWPENDHSPIIGCRFLCPGQAEEKCFWLWRVQEKTSAANHGSVQWLLTFELVLQMPFDGPIVGVVLDFLLDSPNNGFTYF